jgi:hypothetical protein
VFSISLHKANAAGCQMTAVATPLCERSQ